MIKTAKFQTGRSEFEEELKRRVQRYFKDNNLSMKGNTRMYIKTATMFAVFMIPFIGINIIGYNIPWLFYGLWMIMAFGIVGLGTGTMHDSIHGSYSKSKKVNERLGLVMSILGGSSLNWKIQHNVLHHTYTNIDGLDDDIHSISILRLSPKAKKTKSNRYQHLYAWGLYGLTTLFWVTIKNYTQLLRYNRYGLVKAHGTTVSKHFLKLFGQQIFYYSILFGIPCLLVGIPFVPVLLGFLLMHFIAGVFLGVIFQSAHVVEAVEYPEPDENLKMANSRMMHQLETTADFAPNNKLITWLFGGLNYQVEHHLFPHICHIHYPDIARIARETAAKYGVAYHVYPSFGKAVKSHYQMLKQLGA